MKKFKFPDNISDVTPSWFSTALSQRYPNTSVETLTLGALIGGSATKAQFFLKYAPGGNPCQLPMTLWVKAGWDIHVQDALSMCATEAHFYQDMGSSLTINSPKNFFEMIDGDSRNGLVILEDLLLRDATFGNEKGLSRTDDLSLDAISKVLKLQAKYHAAFWGSSQLDQYDWLKPGGAIVTCNVVDMYLGFWEDAVELPRFQYVPKSLLNKEKVRSALHAMLDGDVRDGNCLVHGDAHNANLYFDGNGDPGYLDWATVMKSHWAFDVAMFLICAQPPKSRRNNEKDQLRFYLDQLASHNIAVPDFDEAWLAYRQHAMWVILYAFCPTEMHPEELCMRNTQRACEAITDLETIKTLT